MMRGVALWAAAGLVTGMTSGFAWGYLTGRIVPQSFTLQVQRQGDDPYYAFQCSIYWPDGRAICYLEPGVFVPMEEQ